MGLDNIPANYPCVLAATEVRVPWPNAEVAAAAVEAGDSGQGRIDCVATVSAGGCPWHDRLGDTPGARYGMLGTFCWYRGAVAQGFLDRLDQAGHHPPLSFYGAADGLGDDQCRTLAAFMESSEGVFARLVAADADVDEQLEEYRYAVAWLRFAADCGGADAWY
jgi:hypothetical protein